MGHNLSLADKNASVQSNIFSKLAFALAMLNIILVMGAFIFLSPIGLSYHTSYFISMLLIKIAEAGILIGVLVSVISLGKKEKLKYLKVIGVIINFLLFIFIIGAALFATFMQHKYGV